MNEYFEKIASDAYNDEMNKIAGVSTVQEARRNLDVISANNARHRSAYENVAGTPGNSSSVARTIGRPGNVSPTRNEVLPAETAARRTLAMSNEDLSRAKQDLRANVANKATEDFISNRAR